VSNIPIYDYPPKGEATAYYTTVKAVDGGPFEVFQGFVVCGNPACYRRNQVMITGVRVDYTLDRWIAEARYTIVGGTGALCRDCSEAGYRTP
jgi:hypothetical protein